MLFPGAVDKLRLMRDEKVRNSKEVVDIWNTFLCDNPNGLGNDSMQFSSFAFYHDEI